MQGQSNQPASLHLPEALHPLARFILASPGIQQALGAECQADGFISALQRLVEPHGIAVDADCLRAVLRPDPLGLGRFAEAPVNIDRWPGPGWLPARSIPTGAEPAFDWLWFGSGELNAPFFEDEVRRASALPLNWLLRTRTTLASLIGGHSQQAGPPLCGLIFHMSRCGSTLLTQMLRSTAGTVASSEPEPFDAVLRWIAAAGPDPADAGAAIRAMLAALGRRATQFPARHLVKLEVWHSLFLPELRAALPDVPWVYLHRDPVEVLVSQVSQPSMHIVPGALDEERLGLSGFDAETQIEFAAKVLGRCLQGAVEHWHLGKGLATDYREIRAGAAASAAAHFGIALDQSDAAAMAHAARRDAKVPDQVFSSDSNRKQAEATPAIRAAAEQFIVPYYMTMTDN